MAGGSRGGGDVVLGARHLIGVFALLVVVLGIVFTLGYLLGRSRYEDATRSAATSTAPEGVADAAKAPEPASAADSPAEAGRSSTPSWDFYRSGEPGKPPEHLEPGPAATASAEAPSPFTAAVKPPEPARVPSAKPEPRIAPALGSALIPKGAITLQVAALLRKGDALALAQALQEKKFPAIVTTPSKDKYYRVQVGPYPDAKSANGALRNLEKQGFKPIVRH
jgi:cell division septation protein DedD